MIFKPNEYHKNIETINWNNLYNKGKRYLVFDIDNTLDIPDKISKKSEELTILLNNLSEKGFKIIFMSNNHQERVESFTMHYPEYEYSYNSKKPFQKKYIKNFNQFPKNQIVFIGDKIVTDILGGNLYKGYTILVDPLTTQKKYWYTKFMNSVENIIRKILRFEQGHYYE